MQIELTEEELDDISTELSYAIEVARTGGETYTRLSALRRKINAAREEARAESERREG